MLFCSSDQDDLQFRYCNKNKARANNRMINNLMLKTCPFWRMMTLPVQYFNYINGY